MIQYRNQGVTIFESALFRTTSTVVVTDDLVLVVDPTWLPQEIEQIRQYVLRVRAQRPLYLLFTHSDYDHIIGYGAFPEAQVIAGRAFVENRAPEKPLAAIRKFDQEYYIRRAYQIRYPEVDIVVGPDDRTISIGDTRLSFWPAPGHNADGIFTLVEPLGIWIAGDYLSNEEFPFIYHSSEDYLSTLDTAERILRKRRPKLLVSGHGDHTVDRNEMAHRIAESREYIQQVRHAVVNEQNLSIPSLWERYDFRIGQQSFHTANVALVKQELSKTGTSGHTDGASK